MFWTNFIGDTKIEIIMCEPHYIKLFLWTYSLVQLNFLTFDIFLKIDIFLTFSHMTHYSNHLNASLAIFKKQ